MKKLPNHVQSLFCASTQINSYNRAVEELVYNSLDAKSTSVAVRVHIEDGFIQVVDNGHGISNKDLLLLGQRYMTSKFFDLCAFKTAPNSYGFRGESLANIIKVSQSVKVTSRHENSNNTWLKTFINGNEMEITKLTTRPSKGTTIEIKGFLYNLNIQKNVINAWYELQNIKFILECLSLVHSNISLSLRDDSKNEVIFTIHKNRDIYQTLYTLFGVDRRDIQELQVEKNLYKVKALIGKSETNIGLHYIYLNGKLIFCNSKLHKIINDNINKYTKDLTIKKYKIKNVNDDSENALVKNRIPFYFIFLTCPLMDYDVSKNPKQTNLEFKNWDQITSLLKKLIKFYHGDVNLKEITGTKKKQPVNDAQVSDRREKVKKIMNKILGSNSKKPRVSQMKNGMKGKYIKRKYKKKPLTISKIIAPIQNNREENKITLDEQVSNAIHLDCKQPSISLNKLSNIRKCKKNHNKNVISKKEIKESDYNNNRSKKVKLRKMLMQKQLTAHKILATKKQKIFCSKNQSQVHRNYNKSRLIKEPLISKFAMQTDSVRRRCNILAHKADKVLGNRNKRNRNIFSAVQYSNIIQDNKNICIRQKYDEIVIHDYETFPPKVHTQNMMYHGSNNLKQKAFQTSYDLVHTILRNQQETNSNRIEGSTARKRFGQHCSIELDAIQNVPVDYRLTFQSHKYDKNEMITTENLNSNNFEKKTRNLQLITVQSQNNFVAPNYVEKNNNLQNKKFKIGKKDNFFQNMIFTINNTITNNNKQNLQETSYSIELSNSQENHISNNNNEMAISNEFIPLTGYDDTMSNHKSLSLNDNTYTMRQNIVIDTEASKENDRWNNYATYTIERSNDKLLNNFECNRLISKAADTIINDELVCNQENNYGLFVPESHCSDSSFAFEFNRNLDPINICETVLNSQDIFENEFESSFNINDIIQNEFQQQNYSNNSIHNEYGVINHNKENPFEAIKSLNVSDNFSHHFNNISNTNNLNSNMIACNDASMQNSLLTSKETTQIHTNKNINKSFDEGNQSSQMRLNNDKFEIQEIEFNLKNRLRFLPKGMSPIFENCHTRGCNYNRDKDCYEDSIYNNFVNDVQANCEIFEPRVQNVNDLTARGIEKVNKRFENDKASLKFDGQSIKNAKVLGQVDEKFIAAIIKAKCNESDELSEYLVLFDQHAVHERVKLERNLSDYFDGNKWKSVSLDEVLLKASKDELLYLHNYTDKFTKFGVQWTILNDSKMALKAIPEAVLGKNPRQAEKVINAVKNLITEEINNIKIQRGCVSLYPKSIMDLVFSEACRYAIKFGDKLSKEDCTVLLDELSDCKTPFQCAHGRPVMAVIMDIKSNRREYKINMANLIQIK